LRHILPIICMIIILLPIIYSNTEIITADDNDIPILEAELFILDDIPLFEFGEESTIGLRFNQSGFNWTFQNSKGFFYSKLFLPLRFPSLRYLLGYNSVVFEAEVIGNPLGWEAWVSPSSVTYFTGNSSAEMNLHVKVSRPTTANTATIRIKYTAYSGGSNIMGTSSTDVLVSVKQYHLAEVNPLYQHKEVSPNTVDYFPIEVTNRGNYEDTFDFKVSNESNGFLGLVSGQLTLKPGEIGQISIMVLTPYVYLYDFGTQTSINISAYSVYEPSKKFSASISITSKGFLISELFLLTITIIILTIIFIYFIPNIIIDKRRIQIYGKPDKPWKLPNEEKYLQELRKGDRKQYNKIKNMMKDEYQSSLLWFKDYIKNKIIKEKKQKIVKNPLKKFFRNSTKNKEKKEELKIKKPPIIKKVIQDEINNKSDNINRSEKTKIKSIKKIKREEKKQKKKFSE